MFRLLFAIPLIAIFSSCHNCICAPSDGLKLATITFDSTEIDTLIIRKFQKGSNFTSLIDSLQWDRTIVLFTKFNDTFQMGTWRGDIQLKSQYDYQVYVPATNRTFKITEMNEPQRTGDCSGKIMCGNIIVSAKINDTSRAIENDILYLKK